MDSIFDIYGAWYDWWASAEECASPGYTNNVINSGAMVLHQSKEVAIYIQMYCVFITDAMLDDWLW
jgi:hypothetical protein